MHAENQVQEVGGDGSEEDSTASVKMRADSIKLNFNGPSLGKE